MPGIVFPADKPNYLAQPTCHVNHFFSPPIVSFGAGMLCFTTREVCQPLLFFLRRSVRASPSCEAFLAQPLRFVNLFISDPANRFRSAVVRSVSRTTLEACQPLFFDGLMLFARHCTDILCTTHKEINSFLASKTAKDFFAVGRCVSRTRTFLCQLLFCCARLLDLFESPQAKCSLLDTSNDICAASYFSRQGVLGFTPWPHPSQPIAGKIKPRPWICQGRDFVAVRELLKHHFEQLVNPLF